MHTCTCGRRFPGTLEGAWEAKVHAETEGHQLLGTQPAPALARAAAL